LPWKPAGVSKPLTASTCLAAASRAIHVSAFDRFDETLCIEDNCIRSNPSGSRSRAPFAPLRHPCRNFARMALHRPSPPLETLFSWRGSADTASGVSSSLRLSLSLFDFEFSYFFLYLFTPSHPPFVCEHRLGYLRPRAAYATSFRAAGVPGIRPMSIHSSRFEYRM
jgi:hypothetical protein